MNPTQAIPPAGTGNNIEQTATRLNTAYLRSFPGQAARELESVEPGIAAAILTGQPREVRQPVWSLLSPAAASLLLTRFDERIAIESLQAMEAGACANLIGQLEPDHRDRFLDLLDQPLAAEIRELLAFPPDSAGRIMDTRVLGIHANTTVKAAMTQLKRYPAIMRRRIFTLDDRGKLLGQVELTHLVVADPLDTLYQVSRDLNGLVTTLDLKEQVATLLQQSNIEALPVVDAHRQLAGVIRGANAIETLKEDFAADMQTMVGVGREEQALSSSTFAVRKRQGWLQINLLTSFLAAAVVSLFESTIAQFTALAVLMPIAAGQSGNTGAQALAVTMRGLTLREITPRHWLRVMLKETGAGLINGAAIAVTCGLGVYWWSQSPGLALVIALAMIISMTVAGTAGALVPIGLKKLGQDPAQSSSIILTTVTDIAGFMSFLGIATLLSSLLAG